MVLYVARVRTQPFVVVGCIIEHSGKFLLVQEAQGSSEAHGKWNQPAGWVDMKEHLADAALREGREETGLELELDGFLGVYTLIKPREGQPNHAVKFIFVAKPLTLEPKLDPKEISDARWFTLDEIKALGSALRDADIVQEIEDYLAGVRYPIASVSRYTDVT